ncbi:hypothetical protein [Flavobacterium sp. K5-23]|uniref:hypothetical protein n=1 Tax=Flavobacterium sp. K5-23 TaxID=2746225 RepID=UPI0020104250|nr:hypothetical protein [Flavobacterium sp. K5-23]UQD55872.1 hypothetical protein FLAK523_05455 [Flavobacterium sp. K5-23]
MKKIILFSIGLLSSINILTAQDHSKMLPQEWISTISRNKGFNFVKHENIEGSPYNNLLFFPADISGLDFEIMGRYNEESDQIEIQTEDKKIFMLPKDNKYNSIFINLINYKLILVNYKVNTNTIINGYLVEISKTNNFSLLRRDKTIVKPEKQPKTGYDKYQPAKFIKANKEYYLGLSDNTVIPMPNNKKQIQQIYPNKTGEINTFFKTTNYSFKEETDLISIVNFISTL